MYDIEIHEIMTTRYEIVFEKRGYFSICITLLKLKIEISNLVLQ